MIQLLEPAAISHKYYLICPPILLECSSVDLVVVVKLTLQHYNYYKNSFSYSGATLWNSLPRDIRQAESLGLFKRLIKEVRLATAFVESSFSYTGKVENLQSM